MNSEQNNSTQVLVSPNLSSAQLKLASPLQLGIMASGSGSNMEAVAKAIASGELNAEIKVVIYNNPDAKVRSRAAKYNIPSVLIDHRHYRQRVFDHCRAL